MQNKDKVQLLCLFIVDIESKACIIVHWQQQRQRAWAWAWYCMYYVLSTAGEKLTIANHHSFYIVCVSKRLRTLEFYSINNITLVCFFKRWLRIVFSLHRAQYTKQFQQTQHHIRCHDVSLFWEPKMYRFWWLNQPLILLTSSQEIMDLILSSSV